MKLKKKGFGLIAVCLSVTCAVLSFIALAFNFVLAAGVGKGSSNSGASLSDWNKMLNDDTWAKLLNKDLTVWQISRVLMIIALVVIAIVAVLALVNMFVEHKTLTLVTKITGIVSIVLTAAFFVCFFIGGGLVSYSETDPFFGYTYGVNYLPHVGPILLTLFGILAAVFALIVVKKHKTKKAK